MKYFELFLDDAFRTAPQIINWYGMFDVRFIRWESFHELPKRKVLTLAPSPNIVFTDIVSHPFLLVSAAIKDVIRMYGDKSVFREIILLDSVNKQFRQYYLPVFQESGDYELIYPGADGMNAHEDGTGLEWIQGRNIFWIRNRDKRHTIINLDLAESILRRQTVGIDLREVMLRRKRNEGGKHQSRTFR